MCVYLTISYNKERENASCYGGFLSFLGVRRAELAGLTWSDFDFKECTVHVNKSLLVFRGFGYQHTAIKESNDRFIDAAPEYMAFMQQYKKRRESIRNQLSSELYGK